MADEGYLPPVVIHVIGDDTDFLATLEADKAALADFADTVTNTKLGGDSSKLVVDLADTKAELTGFANTVTNTKLGGDESVLVAKLAQAQTALKAFANQVANSKLGANTAPFWDAIIELKAELAADHSDLDVDLRIQNLAATMAEIAALRGQLSLETIGGLTQATHPGVTYGPISQALTDRPGGAIADLNAINQRLANFGGQPNGGGGKGGGGDLAALASGALWGDASGGFISRLLSPLTMLSSIFSARFGSLGSLAGFGPEHLAMTGVGLAGSATGGLLGGGLLAAGSLGVNAVGMGTDMAGIGQAAGDIKNVMAAQQNLNAVIQEYGKSSQEAQVAQSQLNQALTGFNPVARAAVVQAASTITQFKSMFDQYTGVAEAKGAEIISSVVKTGEAFLPEIGKAASANMSIIMKGLAPLESWLKGPGLAIFTKLENKFTSDLPTAMHAFDQAVEFVLKTLGYLAPMTGGLTKELDRFFTKWNGAGFSTWEGHITKLVNLFHTWDAFIKILVKDIAEIFGMSAGLGSSIIQELTADLNQLHRALESSSGSSALSSLFTTHKKEMIELIQVLVQLGSAFTQMYLIAAPTLVSIATLVLQVISGFITLVDKIPGGAAALGLVLILTKLGIMKGLLDALGVSAAFKTGIASLASSMATLYGRIMGLTVAEGEFTIATGGTRAALIALQTTGIIVVAIGVYELVKHFGALRGLMISGAIAVAGLTVAFIALDSVPVVALIVAIGLAVVGLVAGIVYLATHWSEVWHGIKDITRDAESLVDGLIHNGIIADILDIWSLGLIPLAQHWSEVWGDITSGFKAVVSAIVGIGKSIIDGLVKGIENGEKDVIGAVKRVGTDILHGFSDVLGIFSPSAKTAAMGGQLNAGFAQGITGTSSQAISAAKQVSQQIIAAFGSLSATGKVSAAVKGIEGIFGGLSKVFTNLSTLSTKSAKITNTAINSIVTALGILSTDAPMVVGAVNSIVSSYRSLDKAKTVATAMSNLASVLSDLGKVFTDLGNDTKSSADITSAALVTINSKLQLIATFAPVLVGSVDDIRSEFSKLGNMKDLNDELGSLNTLFKNLGNVFTNLSKAASDSAAVTPNSLAQITTAISNLGTSLSALPAAVNSVNTGTMTALTSLVTNVTTYLNGTAKSLFTSAGANMMEGLTAGISSAAGAVAVAASSAATNAIGAVHTVTKPGSPSRLYTEEGENWMAGLVQGIRLGAPSVSAALSGSIPHVGSAGSLGLGGTGGNAITQTLNIHLHGVTGKSPDITAAVKKGVDQSNDELIRVLKAGSITSGR